MGWVFPFAAEEQQVFLQEVDEQLQTLEEGLLDLEREGASGDLLAAIFRAAHTLKGSAGTVGHEPMTRLTHALEEVLDGLRSGRLSLTTDMADGLLQAVDRLCAIRQSIATNGGEDVDIEDSVRALKAALAGPTSVEEGGAAAEVAGERPQRRAEGRSDASAPVHGGDQPNVVATVLFGPDCPMVAVRAYQAVLAAQEVGQLIETRPGLADIENERVADRIELHVAGCSGEALTEALRAVPDVREVRVAAEAAAGPPSAPRVQQTVRIDVNVLDKLLDLVGELVVGRTRLTQAIGRQAEGGDEARRRLAEVAAHLGRTTTLLQDEVMRARLLPVESLFRKFPRMVRDAARQLGKDIDLVMTGQDTELDRSVLEEIGDPLVHLLRNAADHGVESPEERRTLGKPPTGRIELSAEHCENRIVIRVQDDGAGIDPERLRAAAVERGLLTDDAARRLGREDLLDLIFAPGMTTKAEATALSGRGVGMDVVKKNIERLNGSIVLSSEQGRGTCVTINIPLTLAIVRALTVRVDGTVFALPLHAIVETERLETASLGSVGGQEVARLRGRILPLIRGQRLLGVVTDAASPVGRPLVHLMAGNQPVALLVDELLGEQEVVIKALDHRLGAVPGIAGVAVLGDGRVALILDPGTFLKGMEAACADLGGEHVA